MAVRLVLAMFVSLDGYIEGPNSEFTPPPWSPDVADKWANHNLAKAGHLIYGRVNFLFNKSFWASEAAGGRPETLLINRLPKTVVSRTLSGDSGWNAKIVKGDLVAALARLKATITGGTFVLPRRRRARGRA